MVDEASRWKVHGTRRVYRSDWVNVDLDDVEIPGGPRFEHHVLRFPRASTGAVVVEGDRVLLLWRHRFTTNTWGWEIPAGWADDGEDPAEAVAREIREETGCRAATITPLVGYAPMNGISGTTCSSRRTCAAKASPKQPRPAGWSGSRSPNCQG